MSSTGRRSGKSCGVWVGSNPTPVLYRGSQHSREFQGLRRQLCKALISGCSQRRTLARASGTQSRSIGVEAPTKGGRHLVTRLPLMAWMPHRAIDQPQMQRVRDRIMSKPITPCPRMAKIAGLSLALLLATGMSAVVPAALPVNPQDIVRSLYDTLLSTMKDGRSWDKADVMPGWRPPNTSYRPTALA
jgi:hypothetical protein